LISENISTNISIINRINVQQQQMTTTTTTTTTKMLNRIKNFIYLYTVTDTHMQCWNTVFYL